MRICRNLLKQPLLVGMMGILIKMLFLLVFFLFSYIKRQNILENVFTKNKTKIVCKNEPHPICSTILRITSYNS